jgi:hypothetical protein
MIIALFFRHEIEKPSAAGGLLAKSTYNYTNWPGVNPPHRRGKHLLWFVERGTNRVIPAY